MSGIENCGFAFWWILPLVLFGLCIFMGFFSCIFRRGRGGADHCMCGWTDRDKQNNRPQ